jgi:hypothetical protein
VKNMKKVNIYNQILNWWWQIQIQESATGT